MFDLAFGRFIGEWCFVLAALPVIRVVETNLVVLVLRKFMLIGWRWGGVAGWYGGYAGGVYLLFG